MESKKLKRMIYIYEENVEFYDSLDNKSAFINEILFAEKKRRAPNTNLDYVRQKVAEIDARAKSE